ncbi:aliphatic sulfonate ABC transporter substrate-binding protein [Aquibacillus halophilus]|uniref:Aliphatic sulfonate ABC transporter substrate-binding protein n=1 Tax=Aquibacillus halophilus TaxID=930132 RepID=A0A6A8D646_9BACI|nr:aliphatic sulfonate ABC transporter substrate-binding protein [Aquibacillus halophilus]MRH41058.1 aliphatic sulfonate ABC transporter substrate-binding protein [Aquibacillus halophilus]
MKKGLLFFSILLAFAGLLAGCGSSSATNAEGVVEKVTIGYFPNINHVPAMVAKAEGYYQEQLGEDIEIEYKTFPDGAAFMTALKTGEIEAGLVGPGPAMNNYTTGTDVNIIAGGSTGGTVILARDGSGIETAEDLAGKTFVTPRVGCTHDVQFETYMKEELGMTSQRIGGEMIHTTGPPAQYQAMFETEKVDVAVAPEPWASVLQQETGAKVIINSTEVSWGTTLPASVLVASGELIESNPDLIQKIVNAHKDATAFIAENPEEAKTITINDIKEETGQELSKEVIDRSWENIGFTYEVDADAVQAFGDSSYDLKFLKEQPDFSDLIDTQFID